MIGTITAISSAIGFLAPPIFNFINKKFLSGKEDTPERTISSLATTNPDALAPYLDGYSKLLESQTKFFNRDVVGNISLWVSNLRASIRPLFVIISLIVVIIALSFSLKIDTNFSALMDLCISSWFGSRLI